MEAIAQTFKQLWLTKKGFEVKDMGNHVVLFVFSDKTDANRVLLGEPWSYDKYLVSLCRLEKNGAVKDLVFDQKAFWVQIHDIPVCNMTPEAPAKIGKVCGEVQPGIRDWAIKAAARSCELRYGLTPQSHYAMDENSAERMGRLVGYVSNTSGC